MKKHISIISLLILVTLLLVYWSLQQNEAPPETPTSVDFAEAASEESGSKPDASDAEEAELLQRFTPEEIENLKYSYQAAQAANQNVIFYGRCIDQDGNPVPGVLVRAKLTKMRRSMTSIVANESFKYYEKLSTLTDSNGRFEFFDEGSYLLLESIEREGFLSPREPVRGFRFGQILYGSAMAGMHQPDPLNPVVFKLWKKGEGSNTVRPEPRRNYGADVGISKDATGRIHYFDLKLGRKTSGESEHTLQITAENSGDARWDPEANRIVKSEGYYSWSYTLSMPGGGIQATNDLFLFRPPESGYEESYSFAITGESEKIITSAFDQKFYFKTPDGNYGAFVFDVRTSHEGGVGFKFKTLYFNPTGERNLEHIE